MEREVRKVSKLATLVMCFSAKGASFAGDNGRLILGEWVGEVSVIS